MKLNQFIDHTILKADTTIAQIETICKEAREYQFKSVCVPPSFVAEACDFLKGSNVKICTVIGFPLGNVTTQTKVLETEIAIQHGATEIDMVIAIGRLKQGDFDKVKKEIQAIKEVCFKHNVLLKVIIETALLSKEEKIKICQICAEVGVDFVKTSTGFSTSGAKIEDIELMRANLPAEIQIKASGGIKTKEFALALLNAGANRLGCSSSIQIVRE